MGNKSEQSFIKRLIPYSYNYDRNWYESSQNEIGYNAMSIINNSEDYIIDNRSDVIDFITLINLVHKQFDFIKENANSPEIVFTQINNLPLTQPQYNLFYSLLLKWDGGYPNLNINKSIRDIMNEIGRIFTENYVGEDWEIQFSKTDKKRKNNIRHELSQVAISKGYGITNQIFNIAGALVDFGNLHPQIIENGIVNFFDEDLEYRKIDINDWKNELIAFIKSLDQNFIILYLEKAIEYCEESLNFHLNFDCGNPFKCYAAYSWNQRLRITKEILDKILPELNKDESSNTQENSEFTTARQVLAMHYIFEYMQVRSHEIDRKVKAEFIEFLTNKNHKNIYDALQNPFITKQKNFRFDDLKFIRTYFENLGLSEIVKAINSQLDKPM